MKALRAKSSASEAKLTNTALDTIRCAESSCEVYKPKKGNLFHKDNNLLSVLAFLKKNKSR